MSTADHLEVARLLVTKAAADLSAARVLAEAEDQDDGVIGFHAQQSVEKALKAVLAVREAEIPRTHDLEYLVEMLGRSRLEVPSALSGIAWLNPWAVTLRYDEIEEPLDRTVALEVAGVAITWARAIVGASAAAEG